MVLFLVCVASISQAGTDLTQNWQRRSGVVLYRLKADASSDEKAAMGRILSQGRVLSLLSSKPAKSHRAMSLSLTGTNEVKIAEELMASGAVDFAEPDYLMPAAGGVPDDPQYGAQWYHQTINSPAAWAYGTGNASVLVAVCDTGVDASHPDLAANISLPGFNVVDGTTMTDPVNEHGTAVAGVIGAVGNNALGVTGMNWAVKILPVRITNNADTTAWCSDMAEGIEWAADHGAKVINLSYETSGCPGTINAASQYAESLGATVFVAAGNSAQDISSIYTSARAFVLVGATDISDHPAGFSNYGSAVTLSAPGVAILTTQNGHYGTSTGTSFAAPLAAGLAALIYSVNPNWSPAIVKNLIFATAKPVATAALFGYGRIDAGAAMAAAQNCLSGNCLVPNPLGYNPPSGQTNPQGNNGVTAANLSDVRVYPNPWRSDRHPNTSMTFDHLTANSDVKIFTISGEEVRRLSTTTSSVPWDLKTDSGDRVASGLYLYLVTNNVGQQTRGKLAVIR